MTIIEKTYSWNGAPEMRTETRRLILHHAAATECGPDTVHRWHLNNGWCGIGYHFFVRKDGRIYRGRPEGAVGAHTYGFNGDSIGICFEGNFEIEAMQARQKEAGIRLVAYILDRYPTICEVKRHRDYDATACPGRKFPFDEIKKGAAKQEDDEMLSYGQFKAYMAKYEAEQDGKPEPQWSAKEGHWGRAVHEGIVNGGAPEGYVKRDELIAILGRLGLLDVLSAVTNIDGTGDGHSDWSDTAIKALTDAGIFGGDGSGNFGWKQCITREAAAKVLYELMCRAGMI